MVAPWTGSYLQQWNPCLSGRHNSAGVAGRTKRLMTAPTKCAHAGQLSPCWAGTARAARGWLCAVWLLIGKRRGGRPESQGCTQRPLAPLAPGASSPGVGQQLQGGGQQGLGGGGLQYLGATVDRSGTPAAAHRVVAAAGQSGQSAAARLLRCWRCWVSSGGRILQSTSAARCSACQRARADRGPGGGGCQPAAHCCRPAPRPCPSWRIVGPCPSWRIVGPCPSWQSGCASCQAVHRRAR